MCLRAGAYARTHARARAHIHTHTYTHTHIRPKTVATPEIIDPIHKLILEDRRISAKSIADQLDISRERVGSIIHEDLDMRKLREVDLEMPERASQKSTVSFV